MMIRYLCVTTFFFLFSTSLHAQIEKKSWLLGGSLGFYHASSKYSGSGSSSGSYFYINPDFGYFITDRFAAGIDFSSYFNTSKVTDISGIEEKYKSITLAAGPFLRYYFLKKTSHVNLVIQPAVWYKTTIEKGQDDNISTLEYNIGAGPVFFLNKNVALELLGNYVIGKWIDGNTKFNRLEIQLGLQIHFNGKQLSNN